MFLWFIVRYIQCSCWNKEILTWLWLDAFCTTFLHPCVFSTNLSSSSIASPVRVLMLSIHLIFGLPLSLPPGMLPYIIYYSRLSSFFFELCQFSHSYRFQQLSFCFRHVQHPLTCSFLCPWYTYYYVIHILDIACSMLISFITYLSLMVLISTLIYAKGDVSPQSMVPWLRSMK